MRERRKRKRRFSLYNWCPPGVILWHGGGYQTAMTHIAVAKSVEGPSTTWLGKVTDEEYNKLAKK